jgi:hypothetical protein
MMILKEPSWLPVSAGRHGVAVNIAGSLYVADSAENRSNKGRPPGL